MAENSEPGDMPCGAPVEKQDALANSYEAKLAKRVLKRLRSEPSPDETQPQGTLIEALSLQFPKFCAWLRASPNPDEGALLRAIEADPAPGKLQQALAYEMDYVPSRWLLEQEAAQIAQLRSNQGRANLPWPPRENEDEPNVYDWARKTRLSGLCFSGGGIRSATFNLGILQGLAARGDLWHWDYLSSVSGGGYIHAWLAVWLKRQHARLQGAAPALRAVEEALLPPGRSARTAGATPRHFWAEELKWLRRYSNYLTPSKSLTSPDVWTAASVWLRNTALNQLLLITALLFLVLLPHLCADWVRQPPAPAAAAAPPSAMLQLKYAGTRNLSLQITGQATQEKVANPDSSFRASYERSLRESLLPGVRLDGRAGWIILTFLIASGLMFVRGSWLVYRLIDEQWLWFHTRGSSPDYQKPAGAADADPPNTGTCGGPSRAAVYLLLPALPLTEWLLCAPLRLSLLAAVLLGLLFLSFCCLLGAEPRRTAVIYQGGQPQPWPNLKTFRGRVGNFCEELVKARWMTLLALAAALLGTGVFALAGALLTTVREVQWGRGVIWHAVPAVELALGPPLMAWVPFAVMVLLAGLAAKYGEDWVLEVFAAIRGRALLFSLILLAFALSLVAPSLLRHWLASTPLTVSAVGAWLLTTAGAVLSGRSGKTTGDATQPAAGKQAAILEALAHYGPYVYIAGVLLLLAYLAESLVGDGGVLRAGLYALGCVALFALFAWQYRLIKFSMFPFYRDRLVRCYLGASNPERDPSPLTGLDHRDTRGLALAGFTPEHYPGPFPIFCTTLNLTTGKDLAAQEQKGASFAFTPLYTGYVTSWTEGDKATRFNGLVKTSTLLRDAGGPNIATAMALSGAALSPNMGYHSNPATAFLLTMFNARLGRWVPNTRRAEYEKLCDHSWRGWSQTWRLFRELGGQSDDSDPWVYLSDGGHFDNMGLYELVRRRCQRIMVCDAEEDGGYKFSGIGMAIRRCRIDFGVEIHLDLSDLRLAAKTNFSTAHWVRGQIRYPDSAKCGDILYVKASLRGIPAASNKTSDLPDAPGDVQSFWLEHGIFPNDPTADQWFTESQFESYRRLGQCVCQNLSKDLFGPEPLPSYPCDEA